MAHQVLTPPNPIGSGSTLANALSELGQEMMRRQRLNQAMDLQQKELALRQQEEQRRAAEAAPVTAAHALQLKSLLDQEAAGRGEAALPDVATASPSEALPTAPQMQAAITRGQAPGYEPTQAAAPSFQPPTPPPSVQALQPGDLAEMGAQRNKAAAALRADIAKKGAEAEAQKKAGGAVLVTPELRQHLPGILQLLKPEGSYITPAEIDKAQEWQAKQSMAEDKGTVVPAGGAFIKNGKAVFTNPKPAPDTTAKDAARLDKSYQFNSQQLETVRKPLVDQAERFGRLVDTVNQKTPQADALIAPELLTVMAGGAGSGLRMNEAEISRIVGGRSKLESLKAALNQWRLDPTKALSVTDAQREQIKALIKATGERASKKLDTLNQAANDLVNADSVEAHRRIVAKAKSALGGDVVGSSGLDDPMGILGSK